MKENLLGDILAYFGISLTQFYSNRRYQNIVRARQVYFYILHLKGKKVCSIANRFRWNHSTIYYSIKVIRNEIQTNNDINDFISNLLKKYPNGLSDS